MTNAVAIAQQGSNNTTFRNRIINGAMVIDQRNAGASVSPTSPTYCLDRYEFYNNASGSKYTVQQSSTAPAGFTNSVVITSTSAYTVGAGEILVFRQAIEGYNVADLNFGSANAKTFTLSFWVRSSLTGTFGGAFGNSGSSRSYPFTYTISSANTWEQKTITVAGDQSGTWLTTNGTGLNVWFQIGVGSTYTGTAGSWAGAGYYGATGATSVVGTNGATLYITGVQLEAGSAASPFENRLYTTELQLCQRYFYVNGNTPAIGASGYHFITTGAYSRAGTIIQGWVKLPVTMRAIPSISYSGSQIYWQSGPTYSLNASFSYNINANASNTDQVWMDFTGLSATGLTDGVCVVVGGPDGASGYMKYSAEL